MHVTFILEIKPKGKVEIKFHCILYISFMRMKFVNRGMWDGLTMM